MTRMLAETSCDISDLFSSPTFTTHKSLHAPANMGLVNLSYRAGRKRAADSRVVFADELTLASP